jgi:hypothetical protein
VSAIPPDEVEFHPHSFGDPAGRLFRWRGGLYRGVRPEAAPFAAELAATVLPRLSESGLVPETSLTDLSLDGFALVLRHEQVPLAAYPTEWCGAMLRTAALAYLDVLDELAGAGLGLKDVHPWNLVFDGQRPLFVDVMSIAPLAETMRRLSVDRFRRYYVNPLLLTAHGHGRLARCLLAEYDGVDPAVLALLPRRARPRRFRQHGRSSPSTLSGYAATVARLKAEVAAVEVVVAAGSDEPEAGAETAVSEALEQVQPATVLELYTVTAAAAARAADAGKRAVAFCPSDAHANAAFYAAQQTGALLLPLVLDFTKPTPAVGYLDHYSIAAADRLRCELVLALDAVRYAVLERRLTFEHVAVALDAFSTRAALVALPRPDVLPPDVLGRVRGYGRDGFVRALRGRFSDVSPLAPDESGRDLFLCRK